MPTTCTSSSRWPVTVAAVLVIVVVAGCGSATPQARSPLEQTVDSYSGPMPFSGSDGQDIDGLLRNRPGLDPSGEVRQLNRDQSAQRGFARQGGELQRAIVAERQREHDRRVPPIPGRRKADRLVITRPQDVPAQSGLRRDMKPVTDGDSLPSWQQHDYRVDLRQVQFGHGP